MSTRSWQMSAAVSVVTIPDSFGWRDASAQTRWFTTSTAFLKSSGRGHAPESRCISVSRVSRARELAISPAWCPPIQSQTEHNTPRAPTGCPTTTAGSNPVSCARSRITNPSSLFVRRRPMSDFPYAENFTPHTLFQSPPASALRVGPGGLLHRPGLSPKAAPLTPAEIYFGRTPSHLSAIPPPRGRPGEVPMVLPFRIEYLDAERLLPVLARKAA